MRYFDLHCDTLYKATTENSDFNNPDYHISLCKSKVFDEYKQMFAIWIPDEIKGTAATEFFNKAVSKFVQIQGVNSNNNHFLALENGSALNGDISNINLLIKNRIRYVTLTWNGENELGGGAFSLSQNGITKFGESVVMLLQKHNIAVDVSHASDKLFYDVVNISKAPVVATHSNSRKITDNKRNLTDEQFKIIRDMGGIVGLNLYRGFLNNDEDKACIDDVLKHAEHFLNLCGENTLCIGADFDGADMPFDITGLETIPRIYQRFCDEFGAKLTKKVFFDNANMYFTNFDIVPYI